jgi:uncharacterized protein involved in exopolysaccharide biosynthesis
MIDRSEISLIELLAVLLRRKRFICIATMGMGVVSAAVACLLPVSFKAEATILPPQQQQSSLAALAGSIGGLAGSGMASQLGLKNPGDLYIGMLQSRSIADAIIEQFHLAKVYQTKLASATRQALAKRVSFASGKDSLIKITVEDQDPHRAADLANAFVDELYRQISRLAMTDAGQRRLFFERQLAKEKDAMADAETALKNAEQTTGLLVPAGQAEILIRSSAQLRAEIASRQVSLQAMRSYATDENPQIQSLKSEIAALQTQVEQLQAREGATRGMEMSAEHMPELTLQHLRKLREVKYHETLYELLARQYEVARIDEAKEGPAIQVIDRAVTPDHKSWPPRALLSLGGAAIAFALACGWTLFAHAIRASPDSATQLQLLNEALRS